MEKFYQKLFFTFILGLHRMYTTRVPYCVCKGTHYSRNTFPRMFRIFLFSYKHSFFLSISGWKKVCFQSLSHLTSSERSVTP